MLYALALEALALKPLAWPVASKCKWTMPDKEGTLWIGLRRGCTGTPGLGADGVGARVQAFIRAVMCNWLVCMALWLATSASTLGSKFMGIWLPISAFAAIGLEHCVANMCAPALVQCSFKLPGCFMEVSVACGSWSLVTEQSNAPPKSELPALPNSHRAAVRHSKLRRGARPACMVTWSYGLRALWDVM